MLGGRRCIETRWSLKVEAMCCAWRRPRKREWRAAEEESTCVMHTLTHTAHTHVHALHTAHTTHLHHTNTHTHRVQSCKRARMFACMHSGQMVDSVHVRLWHHAIVRC